MFMCRYAVDLNWFCQWQRFAGYQDALDVPAAPPGPVTNAKLFAGKSITSWLVWSCFHFMVTVVKQSTYTKVSERPKQFL